MGEINMSITQIDKKRVFANLAAGNSVYVANFDKMTLEDCSGMVVSTLQGYINNTNCYFYLIDEAEGQE